LGSKVRGAVHVVHGVGENIRGTALGALDAFAKNGDTRNEEIAKKGRWETEQGLAALRGQPAPTQQSAGAATVGGSTAEHSGQSGTENELGVNRDQHVPGGQAPGVGGSSADPGVGGPSADQKRMPSYDRKDANQGEGHSY